MGFILKDGTILPDLPTQYTYITLVDFPRISTLIYHTLFKSSNDNYYGYKDIELKVFDCVSKKYISSKGYKFDIGGGLYAIQD